MQIARGLRLLAFDFAVPELIWHLPPDEVAGGEEEENPEEKEAEGGSRGTQSFLRKPLDLVNLC